MLKSQNIPTTGNPINIPGASNHQVYQNGIQNQQPISNGAALAIPSGIDPVRAYVNHIMLPLARAVSKRVPILQAQGVNITEQVVLEQIFFVEFQSVASVGAGVVNSLPATGIRAPPKTKSRSLVPGSVRIPIPGLSKLYFPPPGQENLCWWTYSRGDKEGTNCPKPVGRNGIFCEPCFSNKKTALKNYNNAVIMAHGKPVRDFLLSMVGSTSSSMRTNMRHVPAQVIPPKPEEKGEISVSKYPGDLGELYRSPEGLIYASASEGVTAIGFDGGNIGIILPFKPENMGLINSGVHINDALAKQYAAQGGLRAAQLNSSGQLVTDTSKVSIPIIPQTSNNNAVVAPQGVATIPQNTAVAPQGIPGVAAMPQNNTVVVPQNNTAVALQGIQGIQGIPGIPGVATIPQNKTVALQGIQGIQGIPGVATIPQNKTVASQGIPGVATIPQSGAAVVPNGISGVVSVSQNDVIAPITANTPPVPVGSTLPGAQATPLVGLINQN